MELIGHVELATVEFGAGKVARAAGAGASVAGGKGGASGRSRLRARPL